MTSISTKAKIYSTLGNKESLVPLGIKDVFNTVGLTAGACITGKKVEGKDRFIDEVGTQAIWLLGIPFFKKIIDKTVYKMAGFNADIDSRLLDDKVIFKIAKEKAEEIAKANPKSKLFSQFKKIEAKPKFFDRLAKGKFFGATALTLVAYSALTKFRHKHTEKVILKEIQKEEALKKTNDKFVSREKYMAFNVINQKAKKNSKFGPSFGAKGDFIKQFMFDPVKNTMIVDTGITSERLVDARNPQEFMGYAIKEGGFWAFIYFLGPAIQSYFEKKAAGNNKPIDLDIRVLQNKEFKAALIDGSKIAKDLKAFSTEGTNAEIYKRVLDTTNSDNLVIKMAKLSKIIQTIKGSEEIDIKKYIDIDYIKGIKDKITILSKKVAEKVDKEAPEKAEEFLEQILKLKEASIRKNIVVSALALGVFVPAIMVTLRFADKNNKGFMVKKQMEEKLKSDKAKGFPA